MKDINKKLDKLFKPLLILDNLLMKLIKKYPSTKWQKGKDHPRYD